MFRSSGEAEGGDAGWVVAGQVVLAAVAFLVVVHVVVEVAVNDYGAELEDDLGAVGGPSGPGYSESVFDDESAGALDHAGGDRPAFLQGLVVAHVLVVVREVGDGPVHVGEVEVAGAGTGPGFRGDGGEGGGDGLRAAVQDPQQLPRLILIILSVIAIIFLHWLAVPLIFLFYIIISLAFKNRIA